MNQNHNQESFQKGQAFEDFVEKLLFPASHYALLHKTNSFDQNSQRYVGDSKKPDFRFSCILTGFEFHVEAKYRSKPYQGHYDILSEQQLSSFPEIHQADCPVYIALGYGGTADAPAYVSLLPYDQYREARILVEDVASHQIPKQMVDSTLLVKPVAALEEVAVEIENVESPTPELIASTIEKPEPIKKNKTLLIYVGVVLFMVAIVTAIFYIPMGQEDSYESAMKTRIKNYYALSDANNLQELKTYISPKMTYWYGTKDPTIEEVVENIKDYRSKFPISESTVDWEKFDVSEEKDGSYYAIYPLEYKVKAKQRAPFKTYDLKLLTIWDDQMRLMSITEVRR